MGEPAKRGIQSDEAALRARIAELETKLANKTKLSVKVSTKGAVSVYGLQRFPLTLYGGQWERLIGFIPTIEKFMKDHADELTTKEI